MFQHQLSHPFLSLAYIGVLDTIAGVSLPTGPWSILNHLTGPPGVAAALNWAISDGPGADTSLTPIGS